MTKRRTRDEIDKSFRELDSAIEIQCTDGNWDYDPYMHGLANGLVIAKQIVTNAPPEEIEILEAPNRWGYQKDNLDRMHVESIPVINWAFGITLSSIFLWITYMSLSENGIVPTISSLIQ